MKRNLLHSTLALFLISFSAAAFAFDTAHVTGAPFVKNELKSFVYYWFSLFDRNRPTATFLEVIKDTGVYMRYPDGSVLTSHANFSRWYGGILGKIKSANHEIQSLEVTPLADGLAYQVKLRVLWTAVAYDGSPRRAVVDELWTLNDRGGPTPIIAKLVGTLVPEEPPK